MLALQTNPAPRLLSRSKREKIVRIRPAQTTECALAGSITEIVVQGENFSNIPMLMPLLAQLSRDDRWFVWIAPPVLLPKQLLLEAGIDLRKVILLNPDSKHSTYELARQALSTGTSHAVVSWPGYLSEEEFSGLESAAKAGQSHGIVIRRREHS
ncbi:cell division inhibitor SulA [Neptuniibacter halophilus]|uniref:cell division inhibitor SulA n=1 Tax=Neptuniibacter halophilus TaxID=651666 RepID=UPI0025728767|nr:SulA-like leucine-rich domain-containing protein [Neptuniibacter halophilus]